MYIFGDTFFETLLIKNIFQYVFIFYMISEFFIFSSTTSMNKSSKAVKRKDDKGSMLCLILGTITCIFLDVFFRRLNVLIVSISFFWIGIVAMIYGILLRIIAVITLKSSFTVSVQINSEQKLIKKGPYKIIRHPAYSGSILTLLGIAMCFRTVFGFIITLFIVFAIYGYRINIEEKVLEKNFKKEYKEYEKNTWKVIPYIW